MTSKELAIRYIQSTEKTFSNLKMVKDNPSGNKGIIEVVLKEARRYLEDAKYYLNKGESEISLVSVSYCEGLLDALKMMGYVELN